MAQNEAVVAQVDELQDGEMRQVEVGGTEVLLSRVEGQYHAIGASCSHFGAPLVNGVLSGTRVICPWHHACFSVVSGNLEEPPGIDSLPCFSVRIEGDDVIVAVPQDAPAKRQPDRVDRDAADERVFAILGGGAAGAMAAETLREDGFTGRIVLITREEDLPYDRTSLSKSYMAPGQNLSLLRDAEFFASCGIEIKSGSAVARLDAGGRKLEFENGELLSYDALLVATGAAPRQLDLAGADLEGIFSVRGPGDVNGIIAAAEAGKRVVVIGASFIGLECAAALRGNDLEVTVVAPENLPFEQVLGSEVGQLFKDAHEQNGVAFRLGTGVDSFVGADRVEKVKLLSGEELEADLVVVGIGVQPLSEVLEGVEKNPDGSVNVDEFLRVEGSDGCLYAAGDIAAFPDAVSGERIRVEHWRLAQQHGRFAAHNMAGRQTPFDQVPFFWTRQFDVNLRYVGHVDDWDEVLVKGDVGGCDFLVYYLKGGHVRGVAGSGRDAEMCAIEEYMRLGKMPPLDDIRTDAVDWVAGLRH